jgi:PiT family inorganic phosphate transporter
MHEGVFLLVLVVLVALAFDYINGFHDTANAIATVVSTHVLPPRTAILMAAVLNFIGAFYSESVAKTIAKGLVDPHDATQAVILAALTGAIVWNLITWRFGIPSSSSHALIGGLVGAAWAHGGMGVIQWKGIWEKVILPLVGSPVLGFVIAFILMSIIYRIFAQTHPSKMRSLFHRLQIFSAAFMAFTHGSNDAQKSMGIITMALVSIGILKQPNVPLWVMAACATAMGLGTMAGGWRIIKTMGHRIVRLQPVHGFAAETSAATVILLATHFKMPVSTTHTIAGSIFGVGASKRLSAVRWIVAQNMVVAWVLTLPSAAAVGALVYLGLKALGAN